MKNLEEIREEYENKLPSYFELVDKFDYEKNGIQQTKDFIKYLLFDVLWKATKK